MPLLSSQFATRRRLLAGLAVAGVVAGFAFGVILTRLGKILAGAPPATLSNYLWNATIFAALAGVCSPMLAWSLLRRVPLWRTIIEPLVWMAAGGTIAVTLGIPALLLFLPPVGLMLSMLSLRRRYPDTAAARLGASEQRTFTGPADPVS